MLKLAFTIDNSNWCHDLPVYDPGLHVKITKVEIIKGDFKSRLDLLFWAQFSHGSHSRSITGPMKEFLISNGDDRGQLNRVMIYVDPKDQTIKLENEQFQVIIELEIL